MAKELRSDLLHEKPYLRTSNHCLIKFARKTPPVEGKKEMVGFHLIGPISFTGGPDLMVNRQLTTYLLGLPMLKATEPANEWSKSLLSIGSQKHKWCAPWH
jgi:hypothetical protein